MQELAEDSAVGVSSSTNSDVLPKAQVLYLMSDTILLPVPGTLGLIGFDAADVVRGALHQGLDQSVSLSLKAGGTGLHTVGVLEASRNYTTWSFKLSR